MFLADGYGLPEKSLNSLPQQGTFPIYEDVLEFADSIRKLKALPGVTSILSSLDDPRLDNEVLSAFDQALDCLQHTHETVWQATRAPSSQNPTEIAPLVFRKLGHRMTVAENGSEALQKLAKEPFDAVLMDVEMPEMDGMEATRRIRAGEAGAKNKGIPIIAMTAHAMVGYERACAEAGMDVYLSKPVSLKGLATALDQFDKTSALSPSNPVPAQGNGSVLNKEAALDRFDGDEELYQQVCAEFPAICRSRLLAFRQAQKKADFETLAMLAHSCKSECGLVGADSAGDRRPDVPGRQGQQQGRGGQALPLHGSRNKTRLGCPDPELIPDLIPRTPEPVKTLAKIRGYPPPGDGLNAPR